MSSLLALCALFTVVNADLPVHCLRHQLVGDWEFTVGPSSPKRQSCGHSKPDNPDSQPSMGFLTTSGGTPTQKKFTLSDPDTVSSEEGTSGTWTMIYDEGFEVAVGDMTFFAFSKFEFVGNPKHNISHCDQTEIGWYRDTGRDSWGCYYGRKVGSVVSDQSAAPADQTAAPAAPQAQPQPQASPSSKLDDSLSDLAVMAPDQPQQQTQQQQPQQQDLMAPVAMPSLDQPTLTMDATPLESAQPTQPAQPAQPAQADPVHDASLLFTEPAAYTAWVPQATSYDTPMSREWQQQIANALNFLQLGWEAAPYHNHRMFSGKSPRQLNKNAGIRRAKPTERNVPLQEPSAFLGINSKVRRVSAAQFADTNMDWRNKDGKNWLTPVVTQGDCGSCYTISTVHMMTARNRIRAQDTTAPSFSMSFPLYCSEYNQGCDGGYGFLQSKWSEDVGLIPESCAPFSEGGGSCKLAPSCDLGAKRYRAVNHHYVGGFYGGSDEQQMKQELVQNGPMVVSFEPAEDFMYYKGGVYKSGARAIHQEWEQVDHAVLAVGYGDDAGDYWTCQNSWGNDWGEEGYFRMARGIDESGVEGIVVAAEVVEEDSNQVLDDFLAAL